MDPRFRYDPHPHEVLFQMSITETGQIGLGSPPWKDAGRYLRNSPISYVDRVETPVLIMQGDMDYVPIQQGEEFFMALYRQGKRARFVRYWGEGHVLDSPANIRDLWQQIYRWFDEFLGRPDTAHTRRADRWKATRCPAQVVTALDTDYAASSGPWCSRSRRHSSRRSPPRPSRDRGYASAPISSSAATATSRTSS